MLNTKQLIINLIFTLIIIIATEFIIFKIVEKDYQTTVQNEKLKYTNKMSTYDEFYNDIFLKELIRPTENTKSELPPIILFGCSFAYGDNLNEKQTFSNKLSKITNSPIYNLSLGGWSVANMLYQIENEQILKQIKEPMYVIYVFVPVQLHRPFLHVYHPSDNKLSVHYDIKGSILKETKKPPFLYSLYTIKKVDNMIAMFKGYNKLYEKERDKITKLYFKQSISNMKKNWKNTKFYIFNFADYTENFLFELEKETDWNLINLSEIEKDEKIYMNTKYTISEFDKHPNEKAWIYITKPFLKKIEEKASKQTPLVQG